MNNNIDTVFLLDRSARLAYIGIKKFLKEADKSINIYFIDPLKFSYIADQEEAFDKFQKGYSNASFFQNPNSNILLLDTCIHSGVSIENIKKLFNKSRFPNVSTAVVDFSPSEEGVFKPDFHLSSRKNCHPFLEDCIFEKTDAISKFYLFGTLSTNERKRYYSKSIRDALIRTINNSERFKEIARESKDI